MSYRRAVAALILFATVSALLAVDPPPRALPPVTTGKDTTVVDGPFEKGGTIDYEAALNARLKGKSTPDTNAVVNPDDPAG